MKQLTERFFKYVKIDTQSDEKSTTCPSTNKQFNLAKYLQEELEEYDFVKTELDKNGYLFATIPSNIKEKMPVIGFVAHLDTSPDMSGTDVKPKVISEYDGKDIILNEEENIILSPNEFPELKNYIGEDIITTNGLTLLGADDKAGITAIMEMAEYLNNNKDVKHGTIKIAFTPDEEIGRGADLFDVEKFGADFAYTIDGGMIGELEYENFNAAGAKITIKGKNVHPGEAKDKMINANTLLNNILNQLPENEVPEKTDGYEGFFHVTSINSTVEHAEAELIIRDHDMQKFNDKKKLLQSIVDNTNKQIKTEIASVEITDQYFNMREKIEPHMHIVDTAKQAMEQVGVTPIIKAIRGGTDGARLSYMGLPTPNIFAGGHNFHSRYEYVPIKSIQKAKETIIKIIEIYTNKHIDLNA